MDFGMVLQALLGGVLIGLAASALLVSVYPGHDYDGRRVSTIAQEKDRNPRLGSGRRLEDFVALMHGLKLPHPKFIDYAVPGNRQCGICPGALLDQMQEYCGHI